MVGQGRAPCWNRCEIEVNGRNIAVRINGLDVAGGELASLLTIDAPATGLSKRKAGYLGLQCHTEVVQFRNIRIKRF